MGTADGTVGRYLSWLLGALATASGVIHVAVAGEHFDVSWMHGTFFAVVGWLQIAWAVAVVLRPVRPVVAAGAALSVGVLAVWTVSRLWGVPVGPGRGDPEPVALADALASGFEAAIAVAAAIVLFRPAVAQRTLSARLVRPGLALATTAVVVASTMALSPAFASDHHHAEAAGDGAGHHGATGGSAHADGHEEAMIMADGSSPCEQAGVSNEGNAAGSGHGHRGPVAVEPLDPATRTEFADQVARADAARSRLATVADAEAAGYRRVSPYVPCIAAHYVNTEALMNDGFDPDNPEIALYAGTDPDSPAVGLSYLVFADEQPEGFAGPNDPWHNHEQICIGRDGVLGVETATEEGCAARGGRMREIGNIWMNHMWNAPGWQSSWGLFSSEHPDLGGRIGDIDAPPDPEASDAFFDENPVP